MKKLLKITIIKSIAAILSISLFITSISYPLYAQKYISPPGENELTLGNEKTDVKVHDAALLNNNIDQNQGKGKKKIVTILKYLIVITISLPFIPYIISNIINKSSNEPPVIQINQTGQSVSAELKKQISDLILEFGSRDLGRTERALERILKIGKPAVPELINTLNNNNDEIMKGFAAKALGKIDHGVIEAIPSLIKYLRDQGTFVDTEAADALINIGKPAVPALIEELENNIYNQRKRVVEVLGRIGPAAKEAVPVLIKTLEVNNYFIRIHTIVTLGKIGFAAKEAVPALMKMLENSDSRIQSRAADTLGEIGPDAKEAVPALIKMLEDNNSNMRYSVFKALGNIGPDAKEAAPVMIKYLEDKQSNIIVAESLLKMGFGTKEAVTVLIKILGDKEFNMRYYEAKEAINKIGPADKEAIPVLHKELKNKDPLVRLFAINALVKIGTPAPELIPALTESLRDDDGSVGKSAAELLEKINKTSGLPIFSKFMLIKYNYPSIFVLMAIALFALIINIFRITYNVLCAIYEVISDAVANDAITKSTVDSAKKTERADIPTITEKLNQIGKDESEKNIVAQTHRLEESILETIKNRKDLTVGEFITIFKNSIPKEEKGLHSAIHDRNFDSLPGNAIDEDISQLAFDLGKKYKLTEPEMNLIAFGLKLKTKLSEKIDIHMIQPTLDTQLKALKLRISSL